MRTLNAAESLAFGQGIGALSVHEFAALDGKRLEAGFAFDEPDESHALIISDFRLKIEDLKTRRFPYEYSSRWIDGMSRILSCGSI
jgi:hypothetical protein